VRAPVPILFTIPNFISAGSGRAMLNVASRLDRARFSPSVAVLRRGGSLEAELERLGIPLIEAAFTVAPRPLATLAWRAWTAAQPFRKRGFVLWHSYHYLDDYTEPIVSRLAGARSWIYTKKNMSWNHRSWWIRTFLARRVAAMNTDMLEHYLSPPRFRRKSVLLPPGVETETYRPGIPPRLELRTRLRTPASTPVIGCVANLVPIKGHTVLIEAMAVGVPVVAPRVAGIPELVHDGRNGLLFTPSNWTELAERMSRLLDDPALCVRIAAGARRTIASEFDIRSGAAKLSQLFGSVPYKRPRRRGRPLALSFGLREAIVFSTLAMLIAVAIALRSGSSSPRPQPLAGSAAAGER